VGLVLRHGMAAPNNTISVVQPCNRCLPGAFLNHAGSTKYGKSIHPLPATADISRSLHWTAGVENAPDPHHPRPKALVVVIIISLSSPFQLLSG